MLATGGEGSQPMLEKMRRYARNITVLNSMVQTARDFRDNLKLPEAARRESQSDKAGLPTEDPGADRAIDCGIRWLCLAQDKSTSADGGVAWAYSLIDGWGTSYPETTGYIIPTMLDYARLRGDESIRARTKRMLDWLVSIQLAEGAFQGGVIDAGPVVPVTFNTGQVLLGLASGVKEFGDEYLEPMCRAADWLVETQDSDGCWRRYPTPYATPGEKAYETHVAWSLLEAVRLESGKSYADTALRNIRWALTRQNDAGWFADCCLTDPSKPLTHTLGYVLRGIIEAYLFTKNDEWLQASIRTADGMLGAAGEDGFIPGRLYSDWSGAVGWACLVGSVQIAHCWLLLYRITGDKRYRNAAFSANSYVRRTMKTSGQPETLGAIKGSFPVNGKYSPYMYINWGCKFFIDSNMCEKEIRDGEGSDV